MAWTRVTPVRPYLGVGGLRKAALCYAMLGYAGHALCYDMLRYAGRASRLRGLRSSHRGYLGISRTL
eukprot:194693-Pyramimonas_sp.AAC.1